MSRDSLLLTKTGLWQHRGDYMQVTTQTITLRKLSADTGKVITDVATHTMCARVVYLGVSDSAENYTEVEEAQVECESDSNV